MLTYTVERYIVSVYIINYSNHRQICEYIQENHMYLYEEMEYEVGRRQMLKSAYKFEPTRREKI